MWVLHEPDNERVNGKVVGVTLNVRSQKYGNKQLQYSIGETSELTVEFQEPASLEVTIAGYEGSGYEGLLVVSVQKHEEGAPGRSSPMRYYGGSSRSGVDSEGRQPIHSRGTVGRRDGHLLRLLALRPG